MKILARIKFTLVFASFCFSAHNALSTEKVSIYDQYVDSVSQQFDQSSSGHYQLISKAVNVDYLSRLESLSDLDENELYKGVSRDPLEVELKINYDKSTPLSLAVALGKVNLVKKFLTVVDDINADELTCWGYRQPYTLAHLALDPQYPSRSDASLSDRLEIIDLIAEKGADFDRIIGHGYLGIYENPPLAAGCPSGHELKDYECFRARALLYGADPSLWGSSHQPVKLESKKFINLIFDYSVDVLSKNRKINPHPSVKTVLERVRDEKIEMLKKLSF